MRLGKFSATIYVNLTAARLPTVRARLPLAYPSRTLPKLRLRMMSSTGIPGAWDKSSPRFTCTVVDVMRKLYPEQLADRSWDNVGLLLDNSQVDEKIQATSPCVMVTNDLSYRVAQDAITQGVSVIISYHPFIFSGLKSITSKDPQQATLLELAKAGIAVYCPHTAVDAAPEGLNTWLADIISGSCKTSRSFAVPCTNAPGSHSPAGYGVIGKFDQPELVAEIIKRLAFKLGDLKHVMVASPVGLELKSSQIKTFAVCAGSGYDVLKDADADLIVTGETSHHSALRAIQQGKTLVTVFHSNSERTYLQEVLAPKLEEQLRQTEPNAKVILSALDKDPFTIIDVKNL